MKPTSNDREMIFQAEDNCISSIRLETTSAPVTEIAIMSIEFDEYGICVPTLWQLIYFHASSRIFFFF